MRILDLIKQGQTKYRLSEAEEQGMYKAALLSELIILTAAIVLIIITDFIIKIDRIEPQGDIIPITVIGAIVTSILMIGFMFVIVRLGRRFSATFRAIEIKIRNSITGRLYRLPMRKVVIIMLAAGFCEELLFRYALLGGLISLGSRIMQIALAKAGALILSSLIFWVAHAEYRDFFTSLVAICTGLILGGAYIITGIIWVPMVAHFIYNCVDVLTEQYTMGIEDNYLKVQFEQATDTNKENE